MITDWLMVIITAIYVVATIFICVFNGKSAKAAHDQTEAARAQTKEMIAQYNAVTRPLVTIRFDIIRSGLMCFIIENEGPQPAKDVKVSINQEFIDNISNANEKRMLMDLNDATFYLASKQKLTVLLGGNPSFNDIAKEIAKIDISYNGFCEHTEIDINQYRFLIIYNSPVEDISQHLKKIKEDEARFHKELIKAMDKPPKVQNVVIHSATEDDAAKFRLYKEVCLNPHSTVIQLSEKLEIDKEYALNMLLELNKVDRLIAYTFHEDTTDDDKALWYKR